MKKICMLSLFVSLSLMGNPLEKSQEIFEREQHRIEQERKFQEQEDRKRDLENSKFLQNNDINKNNEIIKADMNNKIFVKEINLEDKYNLLNQNEKYELLSGYRYKDITNVEITELLSKLINRLISKGYITTVVKLEESSDFEKGILNLKVVEGKIERIEINSGNFLDKYKEFFMFKRNEKDILNVRDLDQATDNFNSLNSNNMKMEILSGSSENSSIIKITNEIKGKYTLSINENNYGEDNQNGIWRGGISLNIDSPLGIGDNIYFTYTTVKDKKPDRDWKNTPDEVEPGVILPIGPAGYDPKKDGALPYKRRLDMFNVGYTLKFRDYTLKLGSSKSIQERSFYAFNTIYDMKTKNSLLSAVLEKVVYRNQRGKISIDLGISRKHNENYLEMAELVNRKLAIGSVNLRGSTNIFNGILGGTIGYEKGLRVFHAEKSPQSQFKKVNFDISYYKPIGERLKYRFNVNGSHTKGVLYGSEKQSIGGVGSVGGYHRNTIQGDKGIEVSNELSYEIKMKNVKIAPYIEYGYGAVRNNKDYSKYGNGYVSGITTGLRFNSKYFDFNFGYGIPQKHSEYVKPEKEIYFSGSVKIVF